jgi:hypothetical protein
MPCTSSTSPPAWGGGRVRLGIVKTPLGKLRIISGDYHLPIDFKRGCAISSVRKAYSPEQIAE